MMPSILSLAFPGENPSFNRSGAVLIPVFLIVGMAADSLLSALESVSSVVWNKRYVWVLGAFLLGWAIFQNYDLVFNQYRKQYDLAAWNTTELGEIVRDFYRMTGNTEHAYLVGFPHWVDSRLVERAAAGSTPQIVEFGSEEFLELAHRLARESRQGSIMMRGEIR